MTDVLQYTALASVTDKTGLWKFLEWVTATQIFHGRAMQILSTGWTYNNLVGQWLDVTEVSAYTWFPEMMDGRVKTLHPLIHWGFLGRLYNPGDLASMLEHWIVPIDMAIVNLYNFDGTVKKYKKWECTFADVMENIDIWWPSMLRSAAKWAKFVIADPADYDNVLEDMEKNEWKITPRLQALLQARVFTITAWYDTQISDFLNTHQAELAEYLEEIEQKIAQMKKQN